MRKIVWIVLFNFAFVYPALAQPAELNGRIRFVWGDEFNGSAVNTNIWKITDQFDNYGDGNGSVALARNVSVSGGYLRCTAVKEIHYCPTDKVNDYDCVRQKKTKGLPYSYTYGRIESTQTYNQQFGYAEAMMHFSHQAGLWPAFWTFIGDGLHSSANAGEIDIMERVANSDAKTVTTNVHLEYCVEGSPSSSCPTGVGSYCSAVPMCYGVEHTLQQEFWNATKYAVYWNPSELVFYINDIPVRRMANPGIIDPLKFIVGMGVSVDYVNTQSVFPSTLFVDYIRVYSLHECLNNTIVSIGQTRVFNHDSHIIKGCIKVDGNGTSGGQMNMIAANTVAMLPNFVVKEGGYLEARIDNTMRQQNTVEELPKPGNMNYPQRMNGHTNKAVTIEETASEITFTVSPNPIVNIAHIRYIIGKPAAVKITLHDIMGMVQDELVNEYQYSGDHTCELNGLNYKAGIYLLVLESGGLKQNRTIVISK